MLECGAGSAQVSLYMAKQGYDCTMLDYSNDGLALGEENFKKTGIKGTFILGDVEKMRFEDSTFDIVYSGGLIEHFKDVRPIFKEMVRILKPGGLFAADIIPKRFSCMSLTYFLNFLVKFLSRILKLQFRGSIRESQRNFPFYENSIPLKEYERIAKEAGLEDVVATGAGLFPPLPLPRNLHQGYARLMEKMVPLWKIFDHSNSRITEIWGSKYAVYGVKRKAYKQDTLQ